MRDWASRLHNRNPSHCRGAAHMLLLFCNIFYISEAETAAGGEGAEAAGAKEAEEQEEEQGGEEG